MLLSKKANNEGTYQAALVCAFVVYKHRKWVFLRRGPYEPDHEVSVLITQYVMYVFKKLFFNSLHAS